MNPITTGIVTAVFAVSQAGIVLAQAWVAPAGTGSVTLLHQRIDNTGHRLTDGRLIDNGRSTSMAVEVEIDYAMSDHLSVWAGLPLVFSKYVDQEAPPPFLPFFPDDQCRCWHGGFQDVSLGARYSIMTGAFALTPSLAVGLPSHAYEYRGEAVVGRRLKEARLAIDVGRRLDMLSPRLSVQGRYAYTFVERVLDVPNNRSNLSIEPSFLVNERLAAGAVVAWQRTHGGLRIGAPPPFHLTPPGDVNTPARLLEHDRLLRDNNWRIGGTASYSLTSVDVFASFIHYLRGTDAHAGRVWTTGISIPFSID